MPRLELILVCSIDCVELFDHGKAKVLHGLLALVGVVVPAEHATHSSKLVPERSRSVVVKGRILSEEVVHGITRRGLVLFFARLVDKDALVSVAAFSRFSKLEANGFLLVGAPLFLFLSVLVLLWTWNLVTWCCDGNGDVFLWFAHL